MMEDQDYSSVRPLVDWLDYNGYTVVTKATKEYIEASGRKVKGDMNIECSRCYGARGAHGPDGTVLG